MILAKSHTHTYTLTMQEPISSLSFIHLAYLVFRSVLQVAFISLSGFFCAHAKVLNRSNGKILSVLNVDVFTPCLIYGKLARSLSIARLIELAVIPVFFVVQTAVSYYSGVLVAWMFGLGTDEANFVKANAVFVNSNALPISLTLSLAYSLPHLYWKEIPNDTQENIASRGLLYVMMFQQLGQLIRWSWGYNKLLRWSGENTELMPASQILILEEARDSVRTEQHETSRITDPEADGEAASTSEGSGEEEEEDQEEGEGQEGSDPNAAGAPLRRQASVVTISTIATTASMAVRRSKWKRTKRSFRRFWISFKRYMNPPLYAMILAFLVACFPRLQRLLYEKDSFLDITFSQAVDELGSVSIPLILLVLGSNLYPSEESFQKTHNHNKLIIGALLGRMALPPIFLVPFTALAVKYVKVNVLSDPIFVVVAFILAVAPAAIQLTQITELNEFFEAEMVDVLFWSYVVFGMPVIVLVVSFAIYVIKWASATS